MSFAERLRLVRQSMGSDVKDFARWLNLSPRELQTYESGNILPTSSVPLLISERTGMDITYFLRETPVTNLVAVSPEVETLEPHQREIVLAQARLWFDR